MPRAIGATLALLASTSLACAGTNATAPPCGDAPCESRDIDRGELTRFVRDRMGIVKACYENSLKRNPELQGLLAIRFTVHVDGTVREVAASRDTLGSPEFADCVVRTVASWKTPFRPPGSVSVEFPFHFRPAH